MELVGYQNAELVYKLAAQGKLGRPSGDGLLTDDLAMNMLLYMALRTYSWPASGKALDKGLACRYYTLGDSEMIKDMGMGIVPNLKELPDEEKLPTMKKRYNTAVTRLKRARRFLVAQGLVQQLEKPKLVSLGRINGGYLLLLGDDKENREVEAYARECLGLSSC